MKKILNTNTENIVDEMLSGYLSAYSRYYERVKDLNSFVYKGRRKDKVSIVIGGGSGHEPLFSGFAGKGLADAVVCGNIFAAPNPKLIYETAKAVDNGKGILFIYGCYAGDNLNFDMAEELLEYDDINSTHVRVWDDCASAPKENLQNRRGIAGDIYVIKIAGAAADMGLPLEEVVRITEKARDNINTIGLATLAASIPGTNKLTFELGDDEIEFGMGLHGEPGIERCKMKPANQLVERMYTELKKEMNLKSGDELAILVNGLGSTTLLELNIVYNEARKLFDKDSLIIHDSEVKSYCTCQEMGGFSLTILKLDEELKKYYNVGFFSPYYSREDITNE